MCDYSVDYVDAAIYSVSAVTFVGYVLNRKAKGEAPLTSSKRIAKVGAIVFPFSALFSIGWAIVEPVYT